MSDCDCYGGCGDFLLQEDGSDLLQESGHNIILTGTSQDPDIDIINMAFAKIGEPLASSIADNTRPVTTAVAIYHGVRRSVLRDHTWRFAAQRTTLSEQVGTPEFHWTFNLRLPGDFVRLIQMESRTQQFAIEQKRFVRSHEETLNMIYVADIYCSCQFDELFRQAFASRLAYELAVQVSRNQSRKQELMAEYQRYIADARHADAMDGGPERIQTDTWDQSRIGGYRYPGQFDNESPLV